MSDPQSSSEDYEQDSVLHDPPIIIQELNLFKPNSSDLSPPCRGSRPVDQCRDQSSAQSASSGIHKSLNLDGPAEVLLHSSASRKKKVSGELSCELGLAVWENPRRICRICHRHFSSGRALGGHMRVHGPLFQPAGSKRKLSFMEFPGYRRPQERDLLLDVSDSKDSDLSSKEKEVLKFEDAADVPILTTDSEGEAVEDGYTGEPYTQVYEGKGHDAADVRYTAVGHQNDRRTSIVSDASDGPFPTAASLDIRHPLYKLRHKPKKSRRFVEEDLAMEMFLAEQRENVTLPYSKGSGFASLERHRVCSECGKSFGSWKALFGHMRCHPEREWRGILPPDDGSFQAERSRSRSAKKQISPERRPLEDWDEELGSDVEDSKDCGTEAISYEAKKFDHMVEEEEVTKHDTNGSEDGGILGNAKEDGWKQSWPTGKRSRRKSLEGKAESGQPLNLSPPREEPTLTSESGSLEEDQEERHVEEIPNFLLMLAEAARKIEQDTQLRKDRLYKPDYELKQSGEGKLAGEALYALSARESHLATSSSNAFVKYECSTCKKSFNSHQALGGHRASHRKMKGLLARTNVDNDAGFDEHDLFRDQIWQSRIQAHDKDPSLHVADRDTKLQQIKGHECSICHRMFATGQALGGHKRCHYIGERVAEAASFTSSNKQFSDEGHSSKLDTEGGSKLDLNMPAPADDDSAEITNHVSVQLRLFDCELKEKVMKGASSEKLSLASWPRKDLSGEEKRSSPWDFESSSWAIGQAVAF